LPQLPSPRREGLARLLRGAVPIHLRQDHFGDRRRRLVRPQLPPFDLDEDFLERPRRPRFRRAARRGGRDPESLPATTRFALARLGVKVAWARALSSMADCRRIEALKPNGSFPRATTSPSCAISF